MDILTIDFPEGFTYDGGDLRFYFTCEGTRFNSGVYFEISSITGQAKQGSSDSKAMDEIELSTNIKLPVLYIGVDPTKTVSGNVSNALGFPVSGAQVTLKNGDVEYYGTADEQGNYSVNVIKYDYTYELIATAAMYTPAT